MLICSRNRALFNGFFLEEWISEFTSAKGIVKPQPLADGTGGVSFLGEIIKE